MWHAMRFVLMYVHWMDPTPAQVGSERTVTLVGINTGTVMNYSGVWVLLTFSCCIKQRPLATNAHWWELVILGCPAVFAHETIPTPYVRAITPICSRSGGLEVSR